MNSLIQLKGTLNEKKSLGKPGPASIPKTSHVSIDDIERLISNLEELYTKWEKDNLLGGALVSVFYKRIVPKSKRITTLLSSKSEPSNESIVGAKFSEEKKHIITHFVSLDTIKKNIDKLEKAKTIVENVFNGNVDSEDLTNIKNYQKEIEKKGLSKSLFGDIISDIDIVSKFGTVDNSDLIDENSIVNYYDIGKDIKDVMNELGISENDYKIVKENASIQFNNPKSFNIFKKQVPYLVAMATYDMANYIFEEVEDADNSQLPSIPDPTNEPIIGVIDTLFDQSVYFKNWVDYEDMVDDNIPKVEKDYEHGTSVTSIIVDGPSFNPLYDDGCGRFRVKHFGVATSGPNSSITIMKKIEQIIRQNPTIHVWNLSLGSELEVNENFISHEAASLDKIQSENNVVFVVAGTNKNGDKAKKIGAPADSI
ncbi:S8 family serine peptidase, partial [Methanosphaera sp.]|uniref:S8 family serine peptidase n=1 Tax=Methanosphaera sp. TaxID=2666342 RepID=UPI0025F87A03